MTTADCKGTTEGAGVHRRTFVRSALAAAAAVIFGDGLGHWLARRGGQSSEDFVDVEIAGAAELKRGESLAFELEGGRQGLLVHTVDGLRAFDRACPHLGCPVVWEPRSGRVQCPCHAAAFDAVSGSVLAGPPPRGLQAIALVELDGAVFASHRGDARPASSRDS